MYPSLNGRSIFHTDQGRWDRRDYVEDRYEFDEENAMDLHEDDFQEPHGHVYSDTELEQVVKELLGNSKQVDASDITVTARNEDITLSGTVRSESEKYAAGSLAQLIHGVGLIRNDLIVKTVEGILPTDVGRDDPPRSSLAGEEGRA